MLSLIGGIAENDREIIRESYKLSAQDNETLLIDWLTELLYLVEDRHALFTSVRVEMVENCVLHAAVTAQTSKNFTKHIKAVTYHDLAIKKIPDGYEVTIVFDV
nr:archease [Anaerolineae bacterium]